MTVVQTYNSGLELASALERAGALTPTQLDLSSRPDLPLESCMALAAFFGQINDASKWWIADLLEFVEVRYGEYVAQVADATKRAPQTIENIISIGKRIPPSRRRHGVTFSTHAEVASLDPNAQRHWLKVAKEENLTKMELRARIKPEELPPARTLICPHCGGEVPM